MQDRTSTHKERRSSDRDEWNGHSPFISNVNNISLSGKLPASDAEVPVDVIVEPQVSARLSFNYKT
jgi:hypothetical protein